MTIPAPQAKPGPATKPIRVDAETYDVIWRLREPGETIVATVRRLLLKERSNSPETTP